MNEQRAWIKSKRKGWSRFTAVMLCFCLLAAACPGMDVMAASPDSAAVQENGGDDPQQELNEQIEVQTGPEDGEDWKDIYGCEIIWKFEDGTLTISGEGAMRDWGYWGDLPWRDQDITEVVIKQGVTSIGNNAFTGTDLTSVIIPENVESIGEKAFSSCHALKNVTISNGVKSIGKAAFEGCEKLESVTISESVTSIGEEAFSNCNALESVTIPETVTSIQKKTFLSCGALASVTISDGVESIGEQAFSNCSALSKVTIPESVISIGESAFIRCSALESVTIPKNVQSIGKSAFYDCGKLESVTIQGNMTSIEESVFYGCSELKSVTIPESVRSIQNYAFDSCKKLESVTIPERVGSIGYRAFFNCISLAQVTFEGTPATAIPSLGSECFADCPCVKNGATGIIVPCGYLETYKMAWSSSSYKDNISKDTFIKHRYTYTADESDGSVITEACPGDCKHSATATLTLQDDGNLTYIYTGGEIKPVTVNYEDGWVGEKPKDITYENNTDVGTAMASLEISGASAELTFTISPATIGENAVTLDSTVLTYNGSEQTKVVKSVVVNDVTLTEGTDYTVSGNTVTDAGDYVLTITGKGNYEGSVSKDFTLGKKPLADDMITVASGPHYYTGEAIEPAVTVKDGSKTLTQDTDYTVSYENNTDVGTADITVTGMGNYTGSVEKTFDIEDKVEASKKAVKDALAGITATNETTKEDIQKAIDAALTKAGITDVTVTVGDLTKKDATTEAAGSITGIISITCKGESVSVTINQTIPQLPKADAEKPETEKPETEKPETEKPGTEKPETVKPDLEKNALALNAGLKVSQTGKNINITWGKVAGADGYDVYVQYCEKKFNDKSITPIKNGKTTKTKVKKVNGKALDLKKNYKVYVLAYKLVDGKKVTLGKSLTAHIVGGKNAKYTNAKAVKVKKKSYSLKKGKTAVIKATSVLVSKGKKKLTNAHEKEFRYASSNKKVATISAKGKIKAVGKGSCVIYVYARNGYANKIKVKVK